MSMIKAELVWSVTRKQNISQAVCGESVGQVGAFMAEQCMGLPISRGSRSLSASLGRFRSMALPHNARQNAEIQRTDAVLSRICEPIGGINSFV